MDDLIIQDFDLFHRHRIETTMDNIVIEYLSGKRIFNKYDIEDKYAELFDLTLNDIVFANCFVEVCFTRCSLKNSKFLNCNLKTIVFKECDLTNSYFDECSIESINFEKSNMDGANLQLIMRMV